MTRRRALARFTKSGTLARRSRPDRSRSQPGRAGPTVRGGLLVVFLACAPLVALAAWHWAYTAGLPAERVQQAARHQVPAVVLQATPRSAGAGSGDGPSGTTYTGPDTALVLARWTAPGGIRRTGEIRVPTGTRAGATVSVWTGASGRLAEPPLTREQVTGQAGFAAAAAIALLAVALLGAGRLARHCAACGYSRKKKGQEAAMSPGLPRMPRMAHLADQATNALGVPPSACRAAQTAAAAQRPVPASYAGLWRASARSADRAGCCPARPSVIVVIPPAATRPHPTDLLLCRHHYRMHRTALVAAGAAIYETDAITPVREVPWLASRP